MPVRSTSTLRRLNLRRATAGTEPGMGATSSGC
jgi:hypothetical protein